MWDEIPERGKIMDKLLSRRDEFVASLEAIREVVGDEAILSLTKLFDDQVLYAAGIITGNTPRNRIRNVLQLWLRDAMVIDIASSKEERLHAHNRIGALNEAMTHAYGGDPSEALRVVFAMAKERKKFGVLPDDMHSDALIWADIEI